MLGPGLHVHIECPLICFLLLIWGQLKPPVAAWLLLLPPPLAATGASAREIFKVQSWLPGCPLLYLFLVSGGESPLPAYASFLTSCNTAQLVLSSSLGPEDRIMAGSPNPPHPVLPPDGLFRVLHF